MLGSTTAPGRAGARDDAPVHVAFRSKHSVGDPGVVFTRLNTQPMRTPVNASPSPSRGPTHDSGTVWFARPSLEETCTLYSLPVSRRTLCHGNERWAREGRGLSLTSCCCDSIVPLRRRLGSKDPQGRSGDEVALKVECVMDGGVHIEKALGRASRLEPLHFALSSSYDLMGVLGVVVRP